MGGGPPSVPQAATPLPQFQPFIQKAADFLTSQVGTAQPTWPGPFAADPSLLQSMGAGYTGALGAEAAGSGAFPTGARTLAATAGGAYLPGASPYLAQIQEGLRSLLNQQLTQQTADLESRYAARGGAGGSPAAMGVGQLEAGSNAALLNIMGQLGLSSLQSERSLQQQAAQAGVAIEPTIANLMSTTGQGLTNISDTALQRQIAEFIRGQQSPYTPLSYLGTATPGGSGYPQYPPSPVASIGSALAGLLTTNMGGTVLGKWLGFP